MDKLTRNNPDVIEVQTNFDYSPAPEQKTPEQIANEALVASGHQPMNGPWDHVMVGERVGNTYINRIITVEEFADRLAAGDIEKIIGAAKK